LTPVQLAFEEIVNTLDTLRIPYMVGGSVASSVHGFFRSTNDIDLVAAMQPQHIVRFASRLAANFYVDPETMQAALAQQRPFNLIHLASGYKFDIFPAAGNTYFETQIERSKSEEVTLGEGASVRCSLATAEDTLLAKLVWYRQGGEQSERQWNDVRGIRSVQGSRLDRTYMTKWARHLKVDDLLDRLLSEEELR
jgi:hypothetical protein